MATKAMVGRQGTAGVAKRTAARWRRRRVEAGLGQVGRGPGRDDRWPMIGDETGARSALISTPAIRLKSLYGCKLKRACVTEINSDCGNRYFIESQNKLNMTP